MHSTDPGFSLKTEFEKIRSLPRRKRWEYIWEYYRLTFFLIFFFLFFLGATGSFLVNGLMNTFFPKESFSIAFAAPGFSFSQEWGDNCLTAIGYDEKAENFQLLTSAPLSDAADDFRINANVWMANGQPDIFVVNENGYRYLLELDALAELPEELLLLAEGRVTDAFALDVSGTTMAKANGLTEGTIYLCIYTDGCGLDRALDLVKYILTET